jgi:hypothetical protein
MGHKGIQRLKITKGNATAGTLKGDVEGIVQKYEDDLKIQAMKCKGVLKLFFIKFLKKKQDFNLNYKLHV